MAAALIHQARGRHLEAGILQWRPLGIAQRSYNNGDQAGRVGQAPSIIRDTTHTLRTSPLRTGEAHSTNPPMPVQSAPVCFPLAVHRGLRYKTHFRIALYHPRMHENHIGSPNFPTTMHLDLVQPHLLDNRRTDLI
jgi:hypothetical protein